MRTLAITETFSLVTGDEGGAKPFDKIFKEQAFSYGKILFMQLKTGRKSIFWLMGRRKTPLVGYEIG